MNLVKQELNAAKGEREVTEEDENEDSEKPKKLDTGMDETELQVRAIIDRIITYTGVGSMLGVIPAMMFISGGVALGLGLYSLAALGLKDAAWWKKLDTSKPMPGSGIRGGGVYHKEADKARKDWMN